MRGKRTNQQSGTHQRRSQRQFIPSPFTVGSYWAEPTTGKPGHFDSGSPAAQRGAGPRALLRPARIGQDHAFTCTGK